MNADTAARLISINRQFYQTLGKQFSATRQRLQPGVQRAIASIPVDARVLDLGCGNGELARQLARRGFSGHYTGVDFSEALLEEARTGTTQDERFTYFQIDLSAPAWADALRSGDASIKPIFDVVLAFAVLHHLPGIELRQRVLGSVRRLVASQGGFIHSEWQFLDSPRLRRRILPWETVGLTSEQVDLGDYLLDWRGGGYGIRYAHQFTEEELRELAEITGFTIRQTYLSDGENNRLGLYQWWAPSDIMQET